MASVASALLGMVQGDMDEVDSVHGASGAADMGSVIRVTHHLISK